MFETTLRYKNLNNRHAVETHPEFYDSILIQAHLLAHSEKALPKLLYDLADDHSLDYYIDPMISDFRAGDNFRNSEGHLRTWHHKYVQALGDPLDRVLSSKGNVDASRLSENDVRGIARSVIQFQENFVQQRVEDDTGKYVDVDARSLQPKAVTPWRHKIQRTEDINVNRTILTHSEDEATIALKPCVYVTKGFIRDTTNRSSVIKMLNEFDVSEAFVLIEGLKKYETSESEYCNVIDFVYDFYKSGIRPHFYYGDFFSNLLAYFGLGGTAYGTLYGEEFEERLESTSGGGMQPRYYVDQIKDFLKVPAAVDLMKRTNSPVCDCLFCDRQFDTWDDLLELRQSDDRNALNPLQKHYIAMRWRHARLVEKSDLDKVLEKVSENFEDFVLAYHDSPQISPTKNSDYLPKWINAIKSRKELSVDRVEALQYV